MRAGRPRSQAMLRQLNRHGLRPGVARDLARESFAVGRDRFDDARERFVSLLEQLLIRIRSGHFHHRRVVIGVPAHLVLGTVCLDFELRRAARAGVFSAGWPKVISNLKSLLETGSTVLQDPYPVASAHSR